MAVRDAIGAKIAELSVQLHRQLTWDRGRELTAYLSFTVATYLAADFCDSNSPWRCGTKRELGQAAAPASAPSP